MAKNLMTEEDVELEIERLQKSEAVRLAQKEWRWKNRRRSYMNTLRWYERRGLELMAQGVSEEDFAAMDDDDCCMERR